MGHPRPKPSSQEKAYEHFRSYNFHPIAMNSSVKLGGGGGGGRNLCSLSYCEYVKYLVMTDVNFTSSQPKNF